MLQLYSKKVRPTLQKQLVLGNIFEVPRLLKISLNVGIGNAREEKAALEHALADLTTITGQKPVVTRAKKAISNFKLRVGDPVGARVTLRKWHMYEFLERLINIALPRVRDFRGLSAKSFDGRGNYSFGIQEQIVFPEIDYDKIDKIRGLDVTLTTSAQMNEEAYHLLKLIGFPFRLDNRYERTAIAVEEKELEEVTHG
ncbi:MAG: 50S ribosomal protein L5 [Candidatus Neomarinimicrobiota bacterium]|nr:50S ribosomal protein L5 [Candidatus Neomarinimicrobiota bacterium]